MKHQSINSKKKVFNKILFLKDIKRKKSMVKIEDENQEKKEEERDNEASKDESTHDPYFAPVVNLPEMEVRLLFNLNVIEWSITHDNLLRFQREKRRNKKSSRSGLSFSVLILSQSHQNGKFSILLVRFICITYLEI